MDFDSTITAHLVKLWGSGLTIDDVLGPVFEGEDQQLWISGAGPASCQMWDVRPDPFFRNVCLNEVGPCNNLCMSTNGR